MGSNFTCNDDPWYIDYASSFQRTADPDRIKERMHKEPFSKKKKKADSVWNKWFGDTKAIVTKKNL